MVVNAPSIPGVTPVAPAATTGDKPSPVASQSIARVQGLPGTQPVSQPQKYLIETNPVLTDLKQFMSSDYLLSGLGYNPDDSAKRLGDGLYEQRLVEQAVVARTGQRFIDGQNTDSGMLKYLMDNAIRSKQQLGLSVGVSLTSAQVAALTHDIVWLEEEQVNGENVLVPVVYLAQANNRLAPDGALIAGNDVNLIAGQNLDNVGTLRASNNLSAQAGNDLTNSGLIQAGNRLNLLAGNTIVNTAGGIIAGRDVNLTVTQGDILNERSVTSHDSSSGYRTEHTDSVDSAARIEAANNLSLQAGRDVNSVGGVMSSGADTTLKAGRDVNLISAEGTNSNTVSGLFKNSSATQYGSRVDAGGDLKVQAGRDISAVASEIDAKRDVTMSAVGDLSLSSAADESHASFTSKKVKSKEDHVSQVSTTVKAGGDVALSAGQDLALTASRVTAGDEAYLYAGKDLNLAAAEDSDYSYYSKTKKGSWGKKSSKMSESENDVAVGSSIQAQGKTTVVAANDINLTGSTINSDKGALAVLAGHDVNLTGAENRESSASAKSKSGGFGLSSTSKMSSDSQSSTSLTGSTLSGDTTLVQAGHDIAVSASNVVSTEETNIQARNSVRIESDAESFSAQHSQSTKKSGLLSTGGIGVTLGSSQNTYKQGTESASQKGSTVGSVMGDVNITAGKDLTVKASDVVAGKDIKLVGQNVNILDAANDSTTRTSQESKKSGLTLALSGVVGEAVNTAVQTAQDAIHENDTRLSALQGVKAGLSGYQAYQGAQALKSGAQAGEFVGISISLGGQKSSSKQIQEQSVSQGSNLTAGGNLSLVATGNGQPGATGGDITVQGSKLQAGTDLLLSAAQDINLRSGTNTQSLDGSNKSAGGAIGVSLGVSDSGAGLSIFANGNAGAGKEKGNGTTWTETTVNAGNKLTLDSGRDATLVGAQANAQQIVADIGRNLTLSSQQDTDRYDSKQTNVSGGASFTFGSMSGSASLSVSQDKLKSNFDSVKEQTGLFAGKDGYQISVGEHTQLDASVIGSTASADKNKLTTGSLGWTGLDNKADFSSQHQSVSGGTGGDASTQFLGNMGSMLLVGANHDGHESSTTYAAISDGQLTIRDKDKQQQDVNTLSHDVEHANNALSPIFDKEKEQQRLRQAQLIGDIANQSMDIIRTQGTIEAAKAAQAHLTDEQKNMPGANPDASYKDRKAYVDMLQGTDAYKSTMAAYGTGSDLQRAAQAVTAAVQGLAGGNLAQAVVGASAPYLAGIIKDNTGDNLEARIMAHAVLGAVLAKSQQNSALAGATGASIGELVAYELYPNKPIDQLSEAEKQKVSALSTLAGGLAAGIVAGNSSDAVAGGIAAKNAVENNQLRGSEGITLAQEQAEYKKRNCGGTSSSRCDELSKNIKELLARDSSVLKDMPAVEGDIGTDPGSRPQPGQLVSCALSGNGVCVVSDRTVKTDLGDEWALEPASDAQSITHKAEVATTVAAQKAYLDEFSKETFAAGCGGMGLAGIACQTYMASGGKNPITGEVATTTERFGFGLQAVLNSAGLFGAVYDGAAASIDLAPVKGAKATVSKNPNATSALTDSEAGTLVERNVLETSPKVINQAEPEVLAKVNNGRSPYSELNGAIGEARGWSQAIESGQTPISGPGKASLPGADYITYDPSSRSVIVWDAKYRAPGGSYPTSLPDSKLQAWQSEIINSVKNMPEGSAKAAAESALKAGRVEGRIFKWPQ